MFGFLIGIAPCVPYVAILTYIACIVGNAVLSGIVYVVLFASGTAIAPIVLGILMGIVHEKLSKSNKLLKVFRAICGIALIIFGIQLVYSILNLLI